MWAFRGLAEQVRQESLLKADDGVGWDGGWFVVEGGGGGGGFEFDVVSGLRSRLLGSGVWFGKGGGIEERGSNGNVRGKIRLARERVGYCVGGG